MRIPERTRHPRAASALSLIAFAAALAGSAVAACGSQPTGTTGTILCGNVSQVNRLVIKRINGLPKNHNRFTFPATVAVSDPQQAQAVAHAACALPPMPGGSMSCGGDFGIKYLLRFTTKVSPEPSTVKVEAGGCDEVHGLSPTRWTARSPAFWKLLAKVLGAGPPGRSTFTGTIR